MKSEEKVYTIKEIKSVVKVIARKYKVDTVYLFGSYARGEATSDSDIDLLVIGGPQFHLTNIFAFAEELREVFRNEVDVYEIHEINEGSDFKEEIMKERLLIA